jgi:transposase-like protein
MRYLACEKLEIIRLVEQSHLPVRRTLEKLGIQPARFYRWYDRLQTGGPEALEDKSPRSKHVWNRIPDAIRERIVQLALDEPELSPRELATRFTDTANYFVSEASVYRLLKAHDLITGVYRKLDSAIMVVKAAEDRLRCDGADALNRAMKRGVLVQRSMSPQLIIIGGIFAEDSAQMSFTEHDHVVQALPADRADESFNIGVLPR